MKTIYKKNVESDGIKFFAKIIDKRSSILPIFECKIYKKYLFFKFKIYQKDFVSISLDYKLIIRDTLISLKLHEESLKLKTQNADDWNGKVITRL